MPFQQHCLHLTIFANIKFVDQDVRILSSIVLKVLIKVFIEHSLGMPKHGAEPVLDFSLVYTAPNSSTIKKE